MNKRIERISLIILDLLTINLAWSAYYWFRINSGWIHYTALPDFFMPMLVICVFWLAVFSFFGLYQSWYTKSRVDEFIALLKAISFGCIVLFFIIFVDDAGVRSFTHTRFLIVVYWIILLLFVGTGRLLLHSFQRRLLLAGIGLRKAVIIGTNERARELHKMVSSHPALGYEVVGFIHTESPAVEQQKNNTNDSRSPQPILGSISELQTILDMRNIKEVLIAVDSADHDKLLHVVSSCNGHDVNIKIIPDLYDIISGKARTNQIYGFPLVEVMPELMAPWEKAIKRLLDFFISLLILILGLPLWLLIALAIKIDSKGPFFYIQERVGKDGKIFRMFKFRSMYEDAEKYSGPVWAEKQDPRVTRVGKILRRLRLDEIPQFINVLRGDMSLVGPRPERPFFVEKLSKEIPLYSRRLKIRPGITGWAQVKHKYDQSVEDVKTKVKYDLFYIENMSLRMDIKILLNTIYVVLTGKGH